MSPKEKVLSDLLTIEYGTINNFFSSKATSIKGKTKQAYRNFKHLEKKGFIKQIPYDFPPRNQEREIFYQVTHAGAKKIGRLDEFKKIKEYKGITNARHESIVKDIALAFLRLYPEYLISLKFGKIIDDIRSDIYISMKTPDEKKEYHYIVEVERKREAGRTYNEKIKRYENLKFGSKDKTRILIVWTNTSYDNYWRPQEYGLPDVINKLSFQNIQFEYLLSLSKNLPEFRYRFMCFTDFYRLNEAVWIKPGGDKTKLINE